MSLSGASQPLHDLNCASFRNDFSCLCIFLNSYLSSVCVLLRRYFVLDPDLGQLHYFVSEQGKSQKPRGSLPLLGASVAQSDEAPHMFIVHAVNGELFKLRGKASSSSPAGEFIAWKGREWGCFSSGFCGSAGMLLMGQFLVEEHQHVEDE